MNWHRQIHCRYYQTLIGRPLNHDHFAVVSDKKRKEIVLVKQMNIVLVKQMNIVLVKQIKVKSNISQIVKACPLPWLSSGCSTIALGFRTANDAFLNLKV